MQRRKTSDKQRPSGGSPQRPSGGSPQRPSGSSPPSSSKDPKAPLPQSTLRQEMTASPPSAGPSQRPSTPPTRRSSGSDDLYSTSQPSSQRASPVPSRVNSPVPQGGQARGRSVPPEASSNPQAGSHARGYSAPPEASSNPQSGSQARGRSATPKASSDPQAGSQPRAESPNLQAAMRSLRLAGEPVRPNIWFEGGPVQFPNVPEGIQREQWKARYEKTYNDGDYKAVQNVMYDMRWGYLEPVESELPHRLMKKSEQLGHLRACEAGLKQWPTPAALKQAQEDVNMAREELRKTEAWLKSMAGRARTWLDANNYLRSLVKDDELFGVGPLGRLTMYTDRIDLLVRVATNQLAPHKYEERMKYLWGKHQEYALDCIKNLPPSLWTL